MKKSIILTMCLFVGLQIAVAQEHVTNIRARQEDRTVIIKYDLKVRSEVKMLISLDDGQHYTDTMKVTGHINKVIPAGKSKVIRWSAFRDLGYGDYPEIRFKFITKEEPLEGYSKVPKGRNKLSVFRPGGYRSNGMKFFATIDASYNSSGIPMVGFTVGMYDRFGWYVTLMTGLDFDYMGYQVVDHCKKDGYIGEILPFYNPERVSKISAVSGMAGGIFQLNDVIYAKAGLGYGMRSVAWQLWEGDYVTNDGFSAHGVDVGAGLLFDMNRFVMTLDGVTTNFHVFEARLGLGFRFTK